MPMQHNTSDPSQIPTDAAQTRVKVDVLARAIASLEEKKQQQAREMEGTVVLGDVVKDLQLDVTPEELLAEVQAQTKATQIAWNNQALEDAYARAEAQRQAARARPPFWSIGKICTLCGIVSIILLMCVANQSAPGLIPNPAPVKVALPMPPQTTQETPITLGALPAVTGVAKGFAVHPLSDIADNRPFGASLDTLESLLHHQPVAQMLLYDAERDMIYDTRKVSTDSNFNHPKQPQIDPYAMSSWTLVKHNGKVYIRGWTVPNAKRLASGTLLPMFNVQVPVSGAERLLPITLPLDAAAEEGLYFKPSEGDYATDSSDNSSMNPVPAEQNAQQLLVRGLPDNPHLWEPWKL